MNEDFAKSVGYLRAVEKRLLSRDNIERVIDAPTANDALKLLSQGDYDFSLLKRPEDYGTVLEAQLPQVYEMIAKISPTADFLNLLQIRYDYHNLKTLLKAKYLKKSGKEVDDILIRTALVDVDALKEAVETGKTKPIASAPALVAAFEAGEKAFAETGDPQMLDIVLDGCMFGDMLTRAEAVGNKFITDYVKYNIDFYNLKSLLRVKKMQKPKRFAERALIDGGLTKKDVYTDSYDKTFMNIAADFAYKYFGDMAKKGLDEFERTGSFSALEKLCDNFLMDYLKRAKYISLGPEPLFAYVLAKESEVRQIRILMVGKINNIGEQALKERLRDVYV